MLLCYAIMFCNVVKASDAYQLEQAALADMNAKRGPSLMELHQENQRNKRSKSDSSSGSGSSSGISSSTKGGRGGGSRGLGDGFDDDGGFSFDRETVSKQASKLAAIQSRSLLTIVLLN